MASFAITLCGLCCWRHLVGQRVATDISVVRSCWSICSLCSESNDANLLLRLLVAVLGTSSLFQIPNITCPTTWRRVRDDQFSSVHQSSLIRGLATPWTYFLHWSLSFVILIDPSTVSLVHVLMLFIQAVRGLHLLRLPGIVPGIISFSKKFPCYLMMWP